MACSPEEKRREQAGDNPGQEDRGSRQPPIETARDQENRHAQQSREEPEIGVRVTLVDEGLDADRPVRDVQVTVEQRPRLDVVEVVRRHAPEGVDSSRPEVPEGPEVRHGDDGDPDENGPGEALAVSSAIWGPLDVLDCLARPEVGEGGAHVPESGSIDWRHLRMVSGGNPRAPGIVGQSGSDHGQSDRSSPLSHLHPVSVRYQHRSAVAHQAVAERHRMGRRRPSGYSRP